MAASQRKQLAPWQLADAARLKRLFETRQSKSSQAEFGAKHGIGTQGAVWQYLNGQIPLNLAAALKFARGIGCALEEISPTLASQVRHVDQPEGHYEVISGPQLRGSVPLISWTMAVRWSEVRDDFQPEDAEMWVPSPKAVGPHAFALRVVGDSMEPKLPDGAIVVIDPDRKAENGDIVLAKRAADEGATLKQLWYDGAIPKLRPVNPRYAVIDLTADTQLIGRAVFVVLDL